MKKRGPCCDLPGFVLAADRRAWSGASGERPGGSWDLDRCIPFVRRESGLDEELLRRHKDAHGVFCGLDDARAPELAHRRHYLWRSAAGGGYRGGMWLVPDAEGSEQPEPATAAETTGITRYLQGVSI